MRVIRTRETNNFRVYDGIESFPIWVSGGGGTPKVRIKGWQFNSVTNSKYLVFNELIDTAADNAYSLNPSQPFVIGEKSVLWFEGTTDTNDTFVSCRFSGIEVRDFDA